MKELRVIIFSLLVIALNLFTPSLMAQTLKIDKINPDKYTWGHRYLHIPFENQRDDTVRVEAQYFFKYENHYLSGHEQIGFDTSYIIPPKTSGKHRLYYDLPGSFGRVKSRLQIRWRFDNPWEEESEYDSIFQSFTRSFSAYDDAQGFDSRKHSPGPSHAMLIHNRLLFEYPRLVLYLLARGTAINEINRMFRTENLTTYTEIEYFREQGLFSDDPNDILPRIAAISENEGFAIRPILREASTAFNKWYGDKGVGELDKLLKKNKIDESLRNSTAFRMMILMTALQDIMINDSIYGKYEFSNMSEDLAIANRVRWIVQGGEYFLPRLCLGAYERDSSLALGTFTFENNSGGDKNCINQMYDKVSVKVNRPNRKPQEIKSDRLSDLMNSCRKKKLTKNIAKELAPFIDRLIIHLPTYQEYQRPYLTDYLIRIVIGDCFFNDEKNQKVDYLIVRYE